jgi:hypothetical protein
MSNVSAFARTIDGGVKSGWVMMWPYKTFVVMMGDDDDDDDGNK